MERALDRSQLSKEDKKIIELYEKLHIERNKAMTAEDKLQQAEADNAVLREALQSIEWKETQEGGDYRMALFNCPACDAEIGDGHELDCKLRKVLSADHPGAALLKELEGLRRVRDAAKEAVINKGNNPFAVDEHRIYSTVKLAQAIAEAEKEE